MQQDIHTIEEYIAQFSQEEQRYLREFREVILEVLPPETIEKIAYGIPTFYFKKNIVHFGCFKSHYSFFPGGIVDQFSDVLQGYTVSKGTIQLPKDKPLPKKLVQDITKAALDRALKSIT